MKIYLADTLQRERLYSNKFKTNNLESYYAIIFKKDVSIMKKEISLFLDSGAFSAWSKGINIDIKEYIQFIKDNKKYIDVYAVLDSIGDPELTWKNQQIMEKAGLHPLPCFHYGEDIKYLKRYIANYDYVALGGMVPISNNALVVWLDSLFSKYIPTETKIHGFGMTSLPLMIRYPWYSVDSTSWVMTGRFGAIYVPKKRNNKYDYSQIPYKVTISDQSPGQKEDGKHFTTFSKMEQKVILDYIKEKGYCIGKTDKEGTIIESGVSSDYKKRDELNIIYFLDLEKNLPKWPWTFKVSKSKGLGLV